MCLTKSIYLKALYSASNCKVYAHTVHSWMLVSMYMLYIEHNDSKLHAVHVMLFSPPIDIVIDRVCPSYMAI